MLKKLFKPRAPIGEDGKDHANGSFIRLENIQKSFKTAAGEFPVLKGINACFSKGEFVGVIGKSGSGKSTLINMITGIDRPSSGEVWVGETPVHKLSEGQLAVWRGKNLGIVFQFFQLLPTLSLVDNIMLPMDFCNMYTRRQRRERAMHLLELVEMQDHAYKLPTAVSGGQQQRVAIARAMANDPPVLIADEPTGNLDSRTAEVIFHMFEDLVKQGKTILMVTHDSSLAKRVNRTLLITDGEIVSEYVARALPTLTQDQMLAATHKLKPIRFEPGAVIIQEGTQGDMFYILTSGRADVVLHRTSGSDVIVTQLKPGQYFGEIQLLRGGQRTATVKATEYEPVEVVALDRATFEGLVSESDATREALEHVVQQRLGEDQAVKKD